MLTYSRSSAAQGALVVAAAAAALLGGFSLVSPAFADSPADVVPQGSAINDAFGLLAHDNLLGQNVIGSSFAGRPRYTRAQLAAFFKTELLDSRENRSRARENKQATEAVRSVLFSLRPELETLGIDVRAALRDFDPSKAPAASLLLQPELRLRAGGDEGGAARGVGLYRATAQGELGSNVRYVGSVSSWPQEYRRDFFNDTGAKYFPELNELYLEGRAGRHNSFTYGVGRRYENWGPGTHEGAVLLSDNAPALDELRFAFPFNLGRVLGRDWSFTQIAATYDKAGASRRYFEARRVERHFSPKWSAEFQEAFITNDGDAAAKLFFLPFAFNSSQRDVRQVTGIRLRDNLDERLNYTLAAGAAYQAAPRTRAYGQFFVDDLKNPFSGAKKTTPRKIAYLLGGTAALGERTDLTLEYATADPTTYTFRNNNAPWRRNPLSNNFGLPGGPDFQEVFARVSHAASPKLLLSLEGRERMRRSDSFPAPTASEGEAAALYRLNERSSVEFAYRLYRQNPFPYLPGDANYPAINPNAVDPSQANGGARVRRSEIQLAYRFWL